MIALGAVGDLSDRLELSGSILDTAPVGMVLTGPSGEVLWSNESARQLLGIESDPTGSPLLDRLHADDRPAEEAAVAALLAGEFEQYDHEQRWIRPDGAVVWVRARVSLATDPAGSPLRVSEGRDPCVIRQLLDVTDRKVVEEELRRSNEELERFAYVASHDLQEPLRVVTGHVQLLQHRLADQLDDEGREWMAFVTDGVSRMQQLIRGLLEYGRVQTRPIEPRPIELDAVLAVALQTERQAIDEASVRIDAQPLPSVVADRGQVEQVFTNLVANAVKFRRPDRTCRIEISASCTGSWCEIVVSDNGIGIVPEHRERAFDVFHRLHSRARYEGTGLGLSICRRIVDRHGGRIWIDDGIDGGIAIHFTLPEAP